MQALSETQTTSSWSWSLETGKRKHTHTANGGHVKGTAGHPVSPTYWPPLQHGRRKARLMIFHKLHHDWIHSHWHQAETSLYYPGVRGPRHFHSLSTQCPPAILATGNSLFPPTQSVIGTTLLRMWLLHHPWDFPFTSSKISTLRLGPTPPVSSVDDG